MRTEQFRRHGLHGPTLDKLTCEGVGVIGIPEATYPLHNAHIDAASSGSARFPCDVREFGTQRVEKPVIGECLLMNGRSAATYLGSSFQKVAVVIPLHIIDVVCGQHLEHGIMNMVKDRGI